jgi:hypothetical protein
MQAYRKFFLSAGASTTVNPMGEPVQMPDSDANAAFDAGQDNG